MELVSAVIITHNRLELLKRAIDSVYDQTYQNLELIVVDDCSTDGTKEFCESQEFKYIYIPKNESTGGNHARNVGIRASLGEYIAFLDDDDYWLPQKIEKQMEVMKSNDCELVHCGKREEIITKKGIKYRDKLPKPIHYGDCHRKVLLNITTTTTNILVKKEALYEIGLFDEDLRFWQEYELLIRLAQRKDFYCVHEVLSVYRVDTKDKSRLTNKYFDWKKAVSYIHEKHKGLYEELNWKEKFGVRILVWKDGAKRCLNSGLYLRFFFLGSVYVISSIILKIIEIVPIGEAES